MGRHKRRSRTSPSTGEVTRARRPGVPPKRTAIFGGDGRRIPELGLDGEVAFFASPRDGGLGPFRQLEARLRNRSYERLVILTRWNSHSATKKLRKLCRRLGIEVVVRT